MTSQRDSTVDLALLRFAAELAADAGRLTARRFLGGPAADGTTSDGITVEHKSDGSEVTAADREAERFVLDALARHCPTDTVLGEETGEHTGPGTRRWIVDPISGTAFFTRRMPLFANLLAQHDEHGPAIGVVNLPMQRETVYAGRGRGCWSRVEPGDRTSRCRVTERGTAAGALTLAMNQQTWSTDLLTRLHGTVALVGGVNHPIAHLVTGRVDAVVMTGQDLPDLAGIPVLVAEAGGVVTDLSGGPLLAGDGGLLAAGPAVHRELLDLLDGVEALR